MTGVAQWRELSVQQLMRYEALFQLLSDLQTVEDFPSIAKRVATQWKYFVGVASWRLVVATANTFLVLDGFHGRAEVAETATISPWDEHFWNQALPARFRLEEAPLEPPPPEHLVCQSTSEIQLLPFLRGDRCVALLTAATHHEPFSDLDLRFLRLFGVYFADRILTLVLRREAMEVLVHQATQDSLTGLLNRRAILERLNGMLALARRTREPLSVILIDIDRFKRVNDEHGHLAGDSILRDIARLLSAKTRDSDSIGRYGGEEFLQVLYPCTGAEAARAAERLRAAVEGQPFGLPSLPGNPMRITISVGYFSAGPDDSFSTEAMLQKADEALYRSKTGGRNRVSAGDGSR